MTFEETIRQIIREELSTIMSDVKLHFKNDHHNDYPPLLKVEEAAKILQISKTRIYELAHHPGFPVIREGRKIRIPTNGLFSWIESQDQSQKII
ncbi:helix-turn-helix domain-containing protein [Anaerobacillus sp. MEB173]|uniref:helix-turn-helix domain-containing protein n=1 Tax=Anaerobacillus sp. MEB173 TaxID=3383345 RepID=UPI003F8FE8C0